MRFKEIKFHTLFTSNGRVYRKGNNAFSVDILNGQDAIFALHERVDPTTPAEVAAMYPHLDKRLL